MTTHTERPSRTDEFYERDAAPRHRAPYEPEPRFSLAAAVRRVGRRGGQIAFELHVMRAGCVARRVGACILPAIK